MNTFRNFTTGLLVASTCAAALMPSDTRAAVTSSKRPVARPSEAFLMPARRPDSFEQAKTQMEAAAKPQKPAEEHETAPVAEEPAAVDPIPEDTIIITQTRPEPTELDWAHVALPEFNTQRRARLDAFYKAAEGSEQESVARMELAEFYASYLLGIEAYSLLENIDETILGDDARLELEKLKTVTSLILGHTPDGDFLKTYEAWPDLPVWAFMAAKNQKSDTSDHVEPGFERLISHYPDLVVRAKLADFLEEAITNRQWTVAQKIAQEFDNHPELKETSAYSYLIGLAAEETGKTIDAFDLYRKAALGDDLYAQKARLGIVRIGLDSGSMTAEQAENYLSSNLTLWRGDLYELEALYQLQDIQKTSGAYFDELETLGKILTSFGERDEADHAKERATSLLRDVYAKGQMAEIPLAEFIKTHNMVLPYFKMHPGTLRLAEKYADRLRSAGATTLAHKTYREILEYLDIKAEVDEVPVDVNERLHLAMKAVRSLMDGGQFQKAAETFPALPENADEELLKQASVLKAEILAENADFESLLTSGSPHARGPAYLRILSSAWRHAGDWQKSQEVLAQLRSEYPDEFSETDMIHLLISTHRAGDVAGVMALGQEFPEIRETPEWRTIAAKLRYDDTLSIPLMLTDAVTRVQQAEETLDFTRSEAQ